MYMLVQSKPGQYASRRDLQFIFDTSYAIFISSNNQWTYPTFAP